MLGSHRKRLGDDVLVSANDIMFILVVLLLVLVSPEPPEEKVPGLRLVEYGIPKLAPPARDIVSGGLPVIVASDSVYVLQRGPEQESTLKHILASWKDLEDGATANLELLQEYRGDTTTVFLDSDPAVTVRRVGLLLRALDWEGGGSRGLRFIDRNQYEFLAGSAEGREEGTDTRGWQ